MRAVRWLAPFFVLALVAIACSDSAASDHAAGSSAISTSAPSDAVRSAAVTVSPTDAPATPAPELTPTASPPPSPIPPPTPSPTPAPPPGPPPPHKVRDVAPPVVLARAAVVIDGDSGAVLFEKDAHTPMPPASTTKILTALLTLEHSDLDEQIDITLDPARTYWGSVMGLRDGDRFSIRDLLYGLMLPSGNDAAYVLASHIAGTERDFAGMMNDRMRSLGLTENSFVNASGLGRVPNANLISAYDLAQVSRVAMMNPEFARLAGTKSWTARGSRAIGMGNLNELLFRYPGADGVKIGWGGPSAGNTIVGSSVRSGHRLFVALLNTPDRAGESAALLNWAFAGFAWDGPSQ